MKVFVWECVSGLTTNYHNSGGVMIIAENLETARSFWESQQTVNDWWDPKKCELFNKDPDFVCGVETQEPQVFEFPDAGCC